MKPLKLPKMNSKEVQNLLDQEKICRIAFRGKDFPYMAPFQYIRIGNTMYFHFTNYGRKIQLVDKDKRVCVSVERFMPDMNQYHFVVLRGQLERVNDSKETKEAVHRLVTFGKDNLSENFLAAHGFNKSEGWEAISDDKSLLIYKLEKISEIFGLKSPL